MATRRCSRCKNPLPGSYRQCMICSKTLCPQCYKGQDRCDAYQLGGYNPSCSGTLDACDLPSEPQEFQNT